MTAEERRKCPAHHIVHDYANLVSSGQIVVDGHHLGQPLTPPLNTHLGHAFYINCRKMYEFFKYPPPTGRFDDMRARDFTLTDLSYKLDNWGQWHEHMKKQLIHVTIARTTRSQVWEGYNENKLFLAEFQAAWHEFLSALKPEHVSSFDEEITDKLRSGSEFRYYVLR